MNPILRWLSTGDLRTDGFADEVVGVVLQQPHLIEDLVKGMEDSRQMVRGHTADALEKIARTNPELLLPYLSKLVSASQEDPVAMVRMHLVMIFGHMALYDEHAGELVSASLRLLQDASAFTASWAIVSLCILGRKYPQYCSQILQEVATLQRHDSPAIRSRLKKAIYLLSHPEAAFPKGWLKSECLDLA